MKIKYALSATTLFLVAGTIFAVKKIKDAKDALLLRMSAGESPYERKRKR